MSTSSAVRRRDLATMGLAAGLLSHDLSPQQASAASRAALRTTGALEQQIRAFSPEESLRQFMRLFSGLEGVVCLTNEGIIHGRPIDEVARPLFGFRSAVIIRTTDTEVWVTESRFNSFPSGISQEEFPRAYSGPVRKSVDILTCKAAQHEFADARRKTLMSQVQMLSDTPWPFWMMMGRRPGNVLWNGFGKKYASFAALPARFRDATERVYPKFLADPWAFPEREFSTAAQMKRLKAAGGLAAPNSRSE